MKIRNNGSTFTLNFDKEEFYTGYAQQIIYRIKDEVPIKERKYDWNTHTWTIPKTYLYILEVGNPETTEESKQGDREGKQFMAQFEDLPI